MPGQEDERGGGVAGFRVGFGEASAAEEAPAGSFRILVVGGFDPSAELATAPPSPLPRIPLAITTATFDEVMSELNPTFEIEVPDPAAPRGKPLRLPLAFAAPVLGQN